VPDTSARRRTRPLTIVCHLLVDAATDGRVVGHVEIVNTGESVPITNVDELVALVTRAAAVEFVDP
jgi:hypothetical protein